MKAKNSYTLVLIVFQLFAPFCATLTKPKPETSENPPTLADLTNIPDPTKPLEPKQKIESHKKEETKTNVFFDSLKQIVSKKPEKKKTKRQLKREDKMKSVTLILSLKKMSEEGLNFHADLENIQDLLQKRLDISQ